MAQNDAYWKMQRIKLRGAYSVAEKEIERIGIVPETDVRIFINYPYGWEAVFGANARVYIITSHKRQLKLSIEPLYGFDKNGNLRRK